MKILIVEDDEPIAKTLESILRDRYYIVDCAADGELGWEFAEAYDYDLILLDINLPKLNGIEFCKRLRSAKNQTPVLLLTALDSSDKKVIGLDAGADDYVVKPFEISELLARIRVLLRRRDFLEAQIIQWEKLSLNSSTHEVTYGKKTLNLTPKEYRLLELFLRNGDRVLTREIILDRLWDVEEAPSENAICAHIKDLRRKLKQAGAEVDLIETVYGVGYRLKPMNTTAVSDDSDRTEKALRQKTKEALAGVWQRSEATYNERMATLERANQAWQAGVLQGQLLQQAQRAAHKLAGGLGVFGFAQGSNLALEMEQLLKIESDKNRSQRFSELLIALKSSLKPSLKPQSNYVNRALDSSAEPKAQSVARRDLGVHALHGGNPRNGLRCGQILSRNRPIILAVDSHPELVQQLVSEMTATDMMFGIVSQPASMNKALQMNFDALIWEFSLADCDAKALDNFALVVNDKVSLPVILFTDRQSPSDRTQIARLGDRVLLSIASLNLKTTKAIVKALQQSQRKTAKILAVDDDPQILSAIANLLDPLKIELTVLDNPQNFWQTIDRKEPDLLILDVNMPYFSGIELCQLLRNDLRWRELPILFFTVYDDLNTLHQILTAGANDYVNKLLTPTELVPKIFNHLNRSQLLASLS